jgi:hypothetical protein
MFCWDSCDVKGFLITSRYKKRLYFTLTPLNAWKNIRLREINNLCAYLRLITLLEEI